jgi:hypothetical protein
MEEIRIAPTKPEQSTTNMNSCGDEVGGDGSGKKESAAAPGKRRREIGGIGTERLIERVNDESVGI